MHNNCQGLFFKAFYFLTDFLVTRYYYDDDHQYSPAMLTDLRSAVVNNETFAVIAVRNGFHVHLKHDSYPLSVMVDKFVKAQEENGHSLMHNVIILNLYWEMF